MLMNKEQKILLKRIKKEVLKDTSKWYLLRLDEHTKILTDRTASFYLPSEVLDFDNIVKEIKETKCAKIFNDLRMARICIAIDETKETYLFEKQFGNHECLTFVDVADGYGFQKKYFKLLPKRNVWYGYYSIDADKKIPVFTFRHKDGSVLATILPVVANS